MENRPPLVALTLRVIAGLGTLYLAWRVRQTGTLRSVVVVIYGWLAWLMVKPERWCALADAGHPDSASLKLQPAR